MPIEQRWSERKPIEMDVALHYPPAGTLMGRTRDISLEGMFVQLQGSELPVQAELQISFFTAGPARNREHRMPACVVHGNEDGVGLMLRHVDYRDFHVLRYMINAA